LKKKYQNIWRELKKIVHLQSNQKGIAHHPQRRHNFKTCKMETIKIKFNERSTDFITRSNYKGAGLYLIEGFEKKGLYYVRASQSGYKYVASLSLHRKDGDKLQKGTLNF